MAAGDEFTYVTSSTAAPAGEEEEEGGALIEEEQEVALTCPEGCGPGDTILVTLPDGSEAEAVVPEGVAAWGAIYHVIVIVTTVNQLCTRKFCKARQKAPRHNVIVVVIVLSWRNDVMSKRRHDIV